jgi:type IV pilus assembly protein PilN
MAKINLLPWRQERRKARQQQFYTLLGGAAGVGVLATVLGYLFFTTQIGHQNDRNAYLQAQIEDVKKKNAEIDKLDARRKSLESRLEVIEKLQTDRAKMVHLFDALARSIADGAMITNIKQDSNSLTISGRAQSNTRVSTYLRNLEKSGWMVQPELGGIELKTGNNALPYEFVVCVQLNDPTAKPEEEEVVAAAPAAAPAGGAAAPAATTTTTTANAAANAAPAAVPCGAKANG